MFIIVIRLVIHIKLIGGVEMTKTKLEEFQTSTCYTCGYCQERKCKYEEEIDIRNSGIIKIWCYGINDVHVIVNGDCYIREMEE